MKSKYREGLLWKVVRIEGKGEGVIAKSDIAPGTLIVEDIPLFIVPEDVQTKNPEDVRMYISLLPFVLIQNFSVTGTIDNLKVLPIKVILGA